MNLTNLNLTPNLCRFELGQLPFHSNSRTDWAMVWESAKRGRVDDIPADIRTKHYRTIKSIQKDHLTPESISRQVFVYYGEPGTGKSHQAWTEAGLDAYPKDPRTKYWDGYENQQHVVIDEFRGGIDIAHVLRWFDKWPVIVECKFGAVSFKATKIWVTSNIHPRDWYPELDETTKQALLRRLNVTHFNRPYGS